MQAAGEGAPAPDAGIPAGGRPRGTSPPRPGGAGRWAAAGARGPQECAGAVVKARAGMNRSRHPKWRPEAADVGTWVGLSGKEPWSSAPETCSGPAGGQSPETA